MHAKLDELVIATKKAVEAAADELKASATPRKGQKKAGASGNK